MAARKIFSRVSSRRRSRLLGCFARFSVVAMASNPDWLSRVVELYSIMSMTQLYGCGTGLSSCGLIWFLAIGLWRKANPNTFDHRGHGGGCDFNLGNFGPVLRERFWQSCLLSYQSGFGRSFSHRMKSITGGVPPSRRSLVAHCERCPWLCMQTCIIPSATEKL